MTKRDFILNEKELAAFIKLNNILEKNLSSTDNEDFSFLSVPDKETFIKNYLDHIAKEKRNIIENNKDVYSFNHIAFWTLNRNYSEIINGSVKEEYIPFLELLQE